MIFASNVRSAVVKLVRDFYTAADYVGPAAKPSFAKTSIEARPTEWMRPQGDHLALHSLQPIRVQANGVWLACSARRGERRRFLRAMAALSCAAPTRRTIALALLLRGVSYSTGCDEHERSPHRLGTGAATWRVGRAAAPRGGSVPLVARTSMMTTNRAAPGGRARARGRQTCGRDEPTSA